MPKPLNLTGQRFGRWNVLEIAPKRRAVTYWRCVCDCGDIGEVSIQNLRSKQSTSCGCRTIESTRRRVTKHGATKNGIETPEYKAWKQAKTRCFSAKNPDFPYYGGRGISMCPEWAGDFAIFFADMGPRPDGYTLDRIDVNGNYAPGNCRWASRYTQSNNTRQCHYVTHLGRRMTLAQLAAHYSVDYTSVRLRFKKGQTPEQIIFALLHGRKRRARQPDESPDAGKRQGCEHGGIHQHRLSHFTVE